MSLELNVLENKFGNTRLKEYNKKLISCLVRNDEKNFCFKIDLLEAFGEDFSILEEDENGFLEKEKFLEDDNFSFWFNFHSESETDSGFFIFEYSGVNLIETDFYIKNFLEAFFPHQSYKFEIDHLCYPTEKGWMIHMEYN